MIGVPHLVAPDPGGTQLGEPFKIIHTMGTTQRKRAVPVAEGPQQRRRAKMGRRGSQIAATLCRKVLATRTSCTWKRFALYRVASAIGRDALHNLGAVSHPTFWE